MANNRFFYGIAAAIMLLSAILQWVDPPLLRDHLESKTYDLRLKLRNLLKEQPIHHDILIVAIDDRSLEVIGRWPWQRSVTAKLIRRIAAGNPKVIGLDLLFTERESAASDSDLADAVSRAGNVVLATTFMAGTSIPFPAEHDTIDDLLWDSAFAYVKAVPGIAWRDWAIRADRVALPVPELIRGVSLGHVMIHPDRDGVLRYELLAVLFGKNCFPSLPLQVARIARGISADGMGLVGGVGVRLGEEYIPTDLSGRVVINYRGPEGSFPTVSATDVLSGNTSPEIFYGKIVLVGASALATYDQKITPFSPNLTGVEKNATVVQNILLNNFVRTSTGTVELGMILLSGLFLTLFLPRLSALQGILIGAFVTGAYVFLSCWLMISHNLWINAVIPVINLVTICSAESLTRLHREEQRARNIRAMFSSYVSPKIVESLINNPDKLRLGGQHREVTVFFSDIIGFTSLAEKLPPEEVVTILNNYYQEMASIIFQWDGTLDKFIGDSIMAVWNAPVEQANHAELAVCCALQMSDRLDVLRKEWEGTALEEIDCGIGINTGEVLVGNVGLEGKKMDYTVIGNNVNMASRLEKMTREYRTRILLSRSTWEALPLPSRGHFTEQPYVTIKGMEEPAAIYAIIQNP